MSTPRFTATHLHALFPALHAFERHKISASRFVECINAVLAGEPYDLGDAWSVPERIAVLLRRDPGLTAMEIAERLALKPEFVRTTLSRTRRFVADGATRPLRWRCAALARDAAGKGAR